MIRVSGFRLAQEPEIVIERVGALLRQRRQQLGIEAESVRARTASLGSVGV